MEKYDCLTFYVNVREVPVHRRLAILDIDLDGLLWHERVEYGNFQLRNTNRHVVFEVLYHSDQKFIDVNLRFCPVVWLEVLGILLYAGQTPAIGFD
ncbi:hypothetical protein AVEN_182559-1 [Araneus ventricosus]|uniref:Uncharacterized protein n=1 Tax=Araneus ventricosus TaxID=182803 RepID=A0A4Y2PRZ1_ARAVE|nr:hypothetical protein AVEN_31119-1 [Araneus ventricosus]GBN53675.1 hypothetical protein AVEN_222861-1 [Araneus ventricosus]GBN54672.1 hypothetical protein AVEN_28670-1 [Araneus ventricosus]GBN54686.1 hypothetical protein AVEN_182559-1 [Araneus ventricosus]